MKRLIFLCVLSVLCITSCSKKEAVLLDDSYTVTLYPNPVRVGGTVNISVYGFPVTAEEITFRLINKNGEVFLETTNSSFNFSLNTYGLSLIHI